MVTIIFVFFPKNFSVLGVLEERGEGEGKVEEEKRRGERRQRPDILDGQWATNIGEEARADWTATCAHDSHVSLNTWFKKSTFYGF